MRSPIYHSTTRNAREKKTRKETKTRKEKNKKKEGREWIVLRVTGRSLIKVSVTQCVERVPRLHALATYDLKRGIGAIDHC